MPTTTWSVARDEISRPLGFWDFATTTNIAGSSTDVISTELSARNAKDDFFNGKWFVLEIDSDGGTPANGLTLIRRVANYTGSSGTLTLAGTNLGSEDEAVDCAIHEFHPADIQRAFNRARQNVFPQLAIVRDIETLVTGQKQFTFTVPSTIRRIRNIYIGERYAAGSLAENLLLNADFEDWTDATTPANWTLAGSGASVNQEKQTTGSSNYAVLSGSNSGRIVVASTTVTTLLQTFDVSSSDYTAVGTEGVECNVSAWVYCTTASRVSVRIASGYGTSHSGTGWELIKHSVNLGATATTVAVGIVASSGAAIPFFVDEIIMVLGQSEVLDKPYTRILNYTHVPPAAGASDGGMLRFHGQLPSHHRLRIVGLDILSSVSADTDTFEIDGELLEPLYNKTRALLCEERAGGGVDATSREWARRGREYEADYERGINNGATVRLPRLVKVPTADY